MPGKFPESSRTGARPARYSVGGRAPREREGEAAGRRAGLGGKESAQRSGGPPLTSTRLKRALSLAGSCTQGITAMGRPAGPTKQNPGRGLPPRDATGSGTQRTPVGGPGGKPARAKMVARARPLRCACAVSRPRESRAFSPWGHLRVGAGLWLLSPRPRRIIYGPSSRNAVRLTLVIRLLL